MEKLLAITHQAYRQTEVAGTVEGVIEVYVFKEHAEHVVAIAARGGPVEAAIPHISPGTVASGRQEDTAYRLQVFSPHTLGDDIAVV